MSKLFLGIDTSNYTTSLSLVRDGVIVKNVRRLLPVAENERGLRQSDALFHHIKALPELSKILFDGEYNKEELCAVGVSCRPRSVSGSYMPCFLAGVAFSNAISGALSVPLYEFSHQEGHVSAALYDSGMTEKMQNKFLSFHVSGGTTDIVLCEKQNDGTFLCERIGGTNDLNAGQAIDRAGVLMGINFPCGAKLDELSQRSIATFGKIKTSVNGFECSLSGLENKAKQMIDSGAPNEDIAAFIFEYLSAVFCTLSLNLMKKYPDLPILFAGGVMSNTRIRDNLSKIPNTYFARRELSSDNACGTALLAYNKFISQ